MIGRMIAILALLAGLIGSVSAGEIADLAREAEAKADAGRHLEAVETWRRAMHVLVGKGPLLLRRPQFIAAPSQGFGNYTPRSNNVFAAGEPLLVYAEPVGMGWTSEGSLNRFLMVADFEVQSADGKVRSSQKEFARFELSSREFTIETYTNLSVRLTGYPPGQYKLLVTYRDLVGNKSAKLELPFEIR
jgi:hypothetical protein